MNMREIKVRFWKANTKEMLSLSEALGFLVNVSDLLNGKYDNFKPLQYIGLEDKNGTEIYTGDIFEDDRRRYKVEFDSDYGGYLPFTDDDGCGCCSSGITGRDSKSGVVIGNIYENPEILGGENASH